MWAAVGLGTEDSVRRGYCRGGARASCDCGKGACRRRNLCEARVEETDHKGGLVNFFFLFFFTLRRWVNDD